MARCLFWSVTDGTNGEVRPPERFGQRVLVPLTITAWYFPISGPGLGNGRRAIIDDAFSADLGQFIDDVFVDVTPSRLTDDANVIGVVPTEDEAVRLVAERSVSSTPEPFYRWILNEEFKATGETTLNVGRGTTGIAIAIYQRGPPISVRMRGDLSLWPLHGIPQWSGPPEPGWARELTAALELGSTARDASPKLQASILENALRQVRMAASTLQQQIRARQREEKKA